MTFAERSKTMVAHISERLSSGTVTIEAFVATDYDLDEETGLRDITGGVPTGVVNARRGSEVLEGFSPATRSRLYFVAADQPDMLDPVKLNKIIRRGYRLTDGADTFEIVGADLDATRNDWTIRAQVKG